jgi:hypothetical protein
MARTALADIIQYLQSHRQAIVLEEIPVFTTVEAAFPTAEQLGNQLLKRLKELSYPYPETTKVRRTFFERLQSLGLVDTLLSESVLGEIRTALLVFEIEERQRELQREGRSGHKNPLGFHRSILQAIFQHVQKIRKLVNEHQPNDQWMARYLHAADEQMFEEARAIFPFYPHVSPRHFPTKLSLSWRDMLLSVYDIVWTALERGGLKRCRFSERRDPFLRTFYCIMYGLKSFVNLDYLTIVPVFQFLTEPRNGGRLLSYFLQLV